MRITFRELHPEANSHSYILTQNEKIGLTKDELVSNASDMILAGSQVGIVLSGMLSLLLSNPEKMAILTKEIIEAFRDNSEMMFQSEASLVYLSACVQKKLRIYTPAPSAIPNLSPSGGIAVGGLYIPGNVS